jgi:hypothetical protein
MPIEFKELIIKAIVEPSERDSGFVLKSEELEKFRKEILKESMRQVKNFLKEQKER